MANIVYFIFCFTLIFGPKYGVIDFSVLLSMFLLPFILKSHFVISKPFFLFALYVMALITYQLLIQTFNQNIEFVAVGRLIRAFVTVIIVGLIFGSRGENFARKIFRSLLLALVFHALLIVIAALYHPINEFFSVLSGNDRIREYRASGLMAGFDIAGYLSIIGMSLVVFDVYPIKSYVLKGIFLITLLLSCFFTSRVSIVISGLLFLYYIVGLLCTSDIPMHSRMVLIFPLGYFFYVIASNAYVIFEVTLSLGFLDIDPSVAGNVLATYSAQDANQFLWIDMFFLPDSIPKIFFGTGVEVLNSDVGYVKEIFRYGIIGLVFAILAHLMFVFKSYYRPAYLVRGGRRLIIFVVLSMFLLTLKNNYIFVRGVFPAFLIIVAAVTNGTSLNREFKI